MSSRQRLFLPLLLLFALLCPLLSGCSPRGTVDPLSVLRNAAYFRVSDENLQYTMEWTGDGAVYRFSSPELLEPLTVRATDGTLRATYRDLETDLPRSFCEGVLPLYRAVKLFRDTDPERGFSDAAGEKPFLRATRDGETFTLSYDPASGEPTRLEWTGPDGKAGGFDLLSCAPAS